MQGGGIAVFKLLAHYSVTAHFQIGAPGSVGFIDLPDFLIAGVLKGKYAVLARKLHYKTVKILRARAYYYLLRVYLYAPAATEVGGYGLFKLRAAGTRGLDQNTPVILAENAAHGLCQGRKREVLHVLFHCGHLRNCRRFFNRGRVHPGTKGRIVATALAALYISLVGKQGIGVLNRYHTDFQLPGKDAL